MWVFFCSSGFPGVEAGDSKNAGSDTVEGEDEAPVEEEGGITGTGEDEDDGVSLKPSPDIDTYFMFTKPAGKGLGWCLIYDLHLGDVLNFTFHYLCYYFTFILCSFSSNSISFIRITC